MKISLAAEEELEELGPEPLDAELEPVPEVLAELLLSELPDDERFGEDERASEDFTDQLVEY